jgi:eukaryotic-like serine/threonine-protein kinase
MSEPETTSSAKRKCVGCGAALTGGVSPDLCPKCLLKLAMETQPAPGPGGTVAIPTPGARSRGLPQAGEQLGHYSIIRPLGVGGMGAVYEAQDLESGRRVALKVLSHTLDSPDARERFFREGRLAASINHPNSVYIFGTEEIGGIPVITMELLSGGTLQDRVRAQGPLPIGGAVDCVLQLIEGLEAAQRLGILHRDIKPSNCYVGEDGTVKIGDFGLSISTAVRTEPALTATGAFLGTPAFCSPEQLRGEELSARSDMYSVGATLYYLLTGRTPFEAKNMVQLLATVLEQRAPSPRKFRPEIPQALAKALLRCLEKQPGERFSTYADLARALTPYGCAAPTPATLGLRLLAGIIDFTLLALLATAINLGAFGSPMAFFEQAMERSPKALACILGWVVLATLYFAVCEGLWGAAAGKALCRLRVAGPARNPPGFLWAWVRSLVFVLPPYLPFWLSFGANPKAFLSASQWTQTVLGFSIYVVMGLLFVTARRRNGFAAVQDLLSGTRVVSRAAFGPRPVPGTTEPPPEIESAAAIGPYHVLRSLAETGGAKWLLAYDLRLLRKVWLRVVPPGTEPVPARERNLGRVGRLRWLTGRRSPQENWDAFEALSGQPFLRLIGSPQPWRDVRYWLHDLAAELSAAEKDGAVPDLELDRIWITAEGRAKLLDFPAPGLAPNAQPPVIGAGVPAVNSFLNAVVTAALSGSRTGLASGTSALAAPLPLHARDFLRNLPRMIGADAVAAALKPLLTRAAAVSRLRRAAIVMGCAAFPLLACAMLPLSMRAFQEIAQRAPGLMELNILLEMRKAAHFGSSRGAPLANDRQIAIYIAHHHRGLITNQAAWTGWPAVSIVRGEARKFAEQSVADYPSPTQAEITEADTAVDKQMPKDLPFLSGKVPPAMPAMALAASLLFYVGFPAVMAAVLFRRGLVLVIAGVTYARKDGVPASRLRLLWRAVVAWAPLVPVFILSVVALVSHWVWPAWAAVALLGLLSAVSVALPKRGIQDLLAGTWPVPT